MIVQLELIALVMFDDLREVAVQRRVINPARLSGSDTTETTALNVPPSAKIGQTEYVGCILPLDYSLENLGHEKF